MSARLEEGKEFLKKGDYGRAEEVFGGLVTAVPSNADARFELGKACYLQKKYPSALEHLCLSAGTARYALSAGMLIAKIYKETGQFEKSLSVLKGLLAVFPDERELRNECESVLPSCIEEIRTKCFNGDYGAVAAGVPGLLELIPENDKFLRNLLLNESEIALKKTEVQSRMRNLIVTLTTACNLRCVMCLCIRERPWEIPERTLDEVKACFPYLERVVWQGGEVFLYKGFEELVETAGRYANLRQVITTNGLLVDERWAKLLLKNRVDMTFSIDGITKEVYETIRPGADFGVLMRNVKRYRDLKKALRPDLNTNLHVVVMRSNYRQLDDYMDFARENGFTFVAFLPIGGNHDDPENIFALNDAEALRRLRDSYPRIREKAREYGINFEFRLPLPQEGGGTVPSADPAADTNVPCGSRASVTGPGKMLCHLPWLQLFIDYDGSIRPDCVCVRDHIVGNVADCSLETAWNSPKMIEYRAAVAENRCGKLCAAECTEGRIAEKYLKFI